MICTAHHRDHADDRCRAFCQSRIAMLQRDRPIMLPQKPTYGTRRREHARRLDADRDRGRMSSTAAKAVAPKPPRARRWQSGWPRT